MKLTLKNIKGITELNFEMPGPGVWIVTGLNGSGKSSLFAAIYRTSSATAFQKYFRTGALQSAIDRYADAEILYELPQGAVSYKYGGHRWRPTPNRQAQLFANAPPYPDIRFVEANAERIEPFPDEISDRRRIKACSAELCNFMSGVLNDTKWLNLKYVNTKRGNSLRAYLIPYQSGSRTHYYSEKSFSLGELCVLKLAIRMLDIGAGGLVLVDEVEMALHPQAQVRLLQQIQGIARNKGLTVLFSTHSATLIKSVQRSHLIYLFKDGSGVVRSVGHPFPALVLGDLAYSDEMLCDLIFYVEDQQARIYLEGIIGIYIANFHQDQAKRPLYRIVPVGGWAQVIEMLRTSGQLFPQHIRRYALLDADAEPSIRQALAARSQPFSNNFNAVQGMVHYLPCTPEQGLIQHIEVRVLNDPALTRDFNSAFPGHVINLAPIVASHAYQLLTKANLRARAKDRLNHIVAEIVRVTGLDETHVCRTLYAKYCEHEHVAPHAALRQLLGPILNAR